MKLIPVERINIETTLTKNEVKTRLLKRIGRYKAKNFQRIDPNYFAGALNEDDFYLVPILNHRNSWRPNLFGSFVETKNGTNISITMRPHLGMLLITLFFMIFPFLNEDLVELFEDYKYEAFVKILFSLIIYGMCTIFFHSDVGLCKDRLLEITDDNIK